MDCNSEIHLRKYMEYLISIFWQDQIYIDRIIKNLFYEMYRKCRTGNTQKSKSGSEIRRIAFYRNM